MSERATFERILAALVGLTAVVAALAAVLQVDWDRRSERASLLAARLPVQIFEGIAASSTQETFYLRAQQDAISLGIEGLARQIASLRRPAVRDTENAIGASQVEASERLRKLVAEMAAIDPATRGVDPRTVRALTVSQSELAETVARQNDRADDADRYSEKQSKTVFALSLAAIAGALLALAAVLRRGTAGRISLATGAFALALSVAWSAWSLV